MFSLTSTDLTWHINAKQHLFSKIKQFMHLQRQLYPEYHWTLKQTEKSCDLCKPGLESSNKSMLIKTTSKISAFMWWGKHQDSTVVYIFKVLLIFLFLNSLYNCRLQEDFDYVIIYKCNKMLFWKYCAPCLLVLPKGLK
jgi:hypothetical protein